MARFPHAVLGGTFDRFHVGHAALLATAFRMGRRVSIGLTTARFLEAHPKPNGATIRTYAARRQALAAWLRQHYARRRWRIVPLHEPLGGSVGPDVDLLVVSAETQAGARTVNAERVRRGLRPVPVAVVPLVLADDLRPVSSRRIRQGEIDPQGRRRAPISIGLSTDAADDEAPAVHGVRRAFPSARIRLVPAGPGIRRAGGSPAARRLADRAVRGRALAIGIARSRDGGWTAVERTAEVSLGAKEIQGKSPRALTVGLARILAPTDPDGAIPPGEPSTRNGRRSPGAAPSSKRSRSTRVASR